MYVYHQRVGRTQHRVSSLLQKAGGGECPPVQPRIFAHEFIVIIINQFIVLGRLQTLSSFVCHIASRLLRQKGHRKFATGSERCSASDHRNPETRAWSFTAVAWWSALTDYSTAGVVQDSVIERTWKRISSTNIGDMSAIEGVTVSQNHAMQIDTYLLTY